MKQVFSPKSSTKQVFETNKHRPDDKVKCKTVMGNGFGLICEKFAPGHCQTFIVIETSRGKYQSDQNEPQLIQA